MCEDAKARDQPFMDGQRLFLFGTKVNVHALTVHALTSRGSPAALQAWLYIVSRVAKLMRCPLKEFRKDAN